jgi:hypothetical protein
MVETWNNDREEYQNFLLSYDLGPPRAPLLASVSEHVPACIGSKDFKKDVPADARGGADPIKTTAKKYKPFSYKYFL